MDKAIHEFWSLLSVKKSIQDDYEISKEKLNKLRINEEGNKSFIIHILAEMGFAKEVMKKIDGYIDRYALKSIEALQR